MTLRRVVLWVALAAGCGSNGTNNNNNNNMEEDMTTPPDLAGIDLTQPEPDLSTGPDLAPLPDLAPPINVPDGMVHIAGSAAKGPFISGVNVDVQGLNPATL